jgi:ribosomal protein L19E
MLDYWRMRLRAMTDVFRQQRATPSMNVLSYEDLFRMLVEAEYFKRRKFLMNRLVTNAGG